MYLGEAYDTIWRLRMEFRGILRGNGEKLEDFLKKATEECYGEFDEQTVCENLREEWLLYKYEQAS